MSVQHRPQGRTLLWIAAALAAVAVAGAYAYVRVTRSPPRTVVSLTFDDGFQSQWTALAILREHGYRGTFYLNSDRLGTPGRLNVAQVRLIADEGNEIGGHTLDHANLARADQATRVREICNDRIALTRLLGSDQVASFAYPYGASTPEVERDVAACGYNSARTVGGLAQAGVDCSGCPPAETTTPHDPYRVRSMTSFVAGTPVAMAQEQILTAERAGGGWVPIVFHEVCDGCSQLAITPQHFRQLLDWMRARGVIVRTVGEVMGGSTLPMVATRDALTAAAAATPAPSAVPAPAGGGLDIRLLVLAAVALLFALPIGGLAVMRAAGRW